jgi:hypothetical protein
MRSIKLVSDRVCVVGNVFVEVDFVTARLMDVENIYWSEDVGDVGCLRMPMTFPRMCDRWKERQPCDAVQLNCSTSRKSDI